MYLSLTADLAKTNKKPVVLGEENLHVDRVELNALVNGLRGKAVSGKHFVGLGNNTADPFPFGSTPAGLGTGRAHLWWDDTDDAVTFRESGVDLERRVLDDHGIGVLQIPVLGAEPDVAPADTTRLYSDGADVFVSHDGGAYAALAGGGGGSGDIEGVTAGAGLTDGGTTGTVTLNVGAGTGITVSADDVAVNQATAFAWTAAHTWAVSDAVTAAVTDLLTLTHNTSGTAAASFGTGVLLRAENATSPNIADQARIASSWLVATHTAETSFLDITLREAGTNRSWLSGSLVGSTTLGHYSATTNAVDDMLTLSHRTSGTAAAGFGSGILFTGEDASDGADNMGRLAFTWGTATAASEESKFKVQLRVGGAALSDRMIIDGGTRAQFAFGTGAVPGSTSFEVATSAGAGRGYFSSDSATGVGGIQATGDSGQGLTALLDGTSNTRTGVSAGTFFVGLTSQAHFGALTNTDSHWITGTADSSADRVLSAIYNSGNRYADFGYFYQMTEMAAPATPAANKARFYLWDDAGTTTFSIIWPSGSVSDIAFDPGP